ncbi:MAG: family N-acetyltransferase [Pseudonocardiales bacterium]|nr:family N-acetyltransferase [Pseudonocardiales bacterium]
MTSLSPADRQFRKDPERQRYTLHVGDVLVSEAEYRILGDAIAFPHTVTAPEHRGNGYADLLVSFAMDDVETTTTARVLPQCWFVADWFEQHPERADLLSR